MNRPDAVKNTVVIGQFGKTHGLKGWLRVNSKLESPKDLLSYQPWSIDTANGSQKLTVTDSTMQGNTLLVHIEGYDVPETAKKLTGALFFVERDLLPVLDAGKFYWNDLEGLNVVNAQKTSLGQVSHLIEAGACDVMVVKGDKEHLIPFDQTNVIKKVDLNEKIIEVDWDADF